MGLNKLGAGNLLIVGSSNTYTGPTTIGRHVAIRQRRDQRLACQQHHYYRQRRAGLRQLHRPDLLRRDRRHRRIGPLGPGLLAITNSFNGTTSVSAGTLQLVNAGALGSLSGGGGNVTFNAPTLIAGGNNGSTTFAGAISGSGGFTKAGAGTMLITNSQTYSGATTISSGVLNSAPPACRLPSRTLARPWRTGRARTPPLAIPTASPSARQPTFLVVELAWHNNNSASVNPVVKYGPAGAPPSGTLTEVALAFNNGLGNVGSNENTAIFILPQGASGYAVGAGSLSVNFGTGTQNYDAVIDAFTLSGVRAIARI